MLPNSIQDIFHDFKRIALMLPPPFRVRGVLLALAAFPLALLELGVAGIVAFFAAGFTDPHNVLASSYVRAIHEALPFLPLAPDQPRAFLAALGIGLAATIFFKNCVQTLIFWRTAIWTEQAGNALGTLLTRTLLLKPYLWYTQQNTADMVTWVAMRQGATNFLAAAAALATGFLTILVLFIGLLMVTPLISLLTFSTLAILVFLILYYVRSYVRRKTEESIKYLFLAARSIYAVFQGFVEVLLYGQRGAFLSDFKRADLASAIRKAQGTTLSATSSWILETLTFFAMAGIICLLLGNPEMSLPKITGTLALIGASAWRILPAVNKCMAASLNMVTYRPYLKPYLENIDRSAGLDDAFPEEAVSPLRLDHTVSFERISLTYPQADSPALRDVSFSIAKGEMVAFIGQSGAGKSTLVGILTGLLAPTSGRLLVDDRELSRETLAAWGKSIGYVPQSSYLMDATLAENIAFSEWGKPPDKKRVSEAAHKAAIDFLDQLPQGFDTPLGEKGVRLSGGQAQRVAIARALYHNPDIIIFDEATSALDGATEKSIQNTINCLRGQLTVVLIAHRLSTIKQSHRVFWFERGTLRMQGTVNEVLPVYRDTMNNNPLA